MDDLGRQIAYWDTAGAAKTFTHPLDLTWLAGVGRSARVLDYGCGYGRTMAELSDHGFRDVSGADLSPALVDRGRRSRPDLRFTVLEDPPGLPYPPASFDLVLLFAVLTCVPDDAAQRELVAELVRVLAPGGLLYVSDMPLQDDARSRERYAAARAADPGTPYGVFTTGDGAVVRHHEPARLRALLRDAGPNPGPRPGPGPGPGPGLDLVHERPIDVTTMNGNPARALQLLARKR
ncbi:class I SAM-dependent methyltransferase [Streptomyces sp. NPDC051109]|uniref:class I SAM-dependent methyltransferase n=1 Tax=Streptomyces sp. NPDC051109 TaxID=3365642 RepID=UPI0037B61FB0